MFSVALYQPQIPPNTGNIIRLCANIGCRLQLIHPLGFAFDDKRVKRAGCDYHELALIDHHIDYQQFQQANQQHRIIAIETGSPINYADVSYQVDDVLLLGSETSGLSNNILSRVDKVVSLPMQPHNRSLNLSNATAIVAYEAWRQLGFPSQ